MCFGVLGYAVFSIALGRNLVADGSWAFLQGLQAEGIWPVDPYRLGVGTLGQVSLAAATAAGVDDLYALRLMHGIGYILVPALVWFLALVLSRRSPLFEILLLGYCATALSSGFVAVSDANSMFAYAALYFAVVVRFTASGERALPYVGLVAAVVLISSHGFTLLLSPFLIVSSVLLRRRSPFAAQQKGVWWASLVALTLSVLVGVASVLRPYSPFNVVAAADVSAPLGNTQFIVVVVWLAVLPLALLPRQRPARVAAIVVLGAALVVLAADERIWASPLEQHATRTMSALVLLLLLVVGLRMVLATRTANTQGETAITDAANPALTALSAGLFVALMIPSAAATVAFARYLDEFSAIIATRQAVIAHDEFVALVPAAVEFGWPFSYPVLSAVLGGGAEHAMVADPVDSIYLDLVDVENPPPLPDRFTGSVVRD